MAYKEWDSTTALRDPGPACGSVLPVVEPRTRRRCAANAKDEDLVSQRTPDQGVQLDRGEFAGLTDSLSALEHLAVSLWRRTSPDTALVGEDDEEPGTARESLEDLIDEVHHLHAVLRRHGVPTPLPAMGGRRAIGKDGWE